VLEASRIRFMTNEMEENFMYGGIDFCKKWRKFQIFHGTHHTWRDDGEIQSFENW